MKGEVERDDLSLVAARGRTRQPRDKCVERLGRAAPADGEPGGHRLDSDAKVCDRVDLVVGQLSDDGAASGQDVREPFVGEAAERFAHGAAACAEIAGELRLDQALAAAQAPTDDLLADRHVGKFGERLMLGDVRDLQSANGQQLTRCSTNRYRRRMATKRIDSGQPASALIGGIWTETQSTLADVDPSTGAELARVAACGAAEVDAAVVAAAAAAPAWSATRLADRATVLERLAALIRANHSALAETECLDTGKPLRQAQADITVAARYFEFYARASEAVYGETIPISGELLAYTLREPHGVTGHIIPWNYPAQITARTLAPALVMGNACVLKPAEDAPLTPLRIAALAHEAGLPPGVLNVVPGLGEQAGAALAEHPGLGHISFTGSPEVGRLVGRAAAESIIPVTLELGGKSPNIVFADADLERAAPTIVNSILQNAGQTCSAGSRLLVERSAQPHLVELLRERFAAVRIGRGIDDPDLGPLISAKQLERVRGYVERGRDSGRLVIGGGSPDHAGLGDGYFFPPTLFDDVAPDAPI
ncbi:MAG: aldehyde dehydrogenase, partial [Gaiellales bacterium]|nr:aldehyde dehydrogenase [Gaiellales bacterium]